MAGGSESMLQIWHVCLRNASSHTLLKTRHSQNAAKHCASFLGYGNSGTCGYKAHSSIHTGGGMS